MARNNGGIVVWNNQDTVPTDGQGGYGGGDSTAAAMALAGGQAQAALTTMENLKVAVNQLPSTSGPTIAISGSVPTRTITIGVPAGRDGMGYAQGQQLLADSAAVKGSAQAAQAAAAATEARVANIEALTAEVPDQVVATVAANPLTQTSATLQDRGIAQTSLRDWLPGRTHAEAMTAALDYLATRATSPRPSNSRSLARGLGVLHIPAGTWDVPETLIANVMTLTIRGEGRNRTTLRTTTGTHVLEMTHAGYVTMQDLTIACGNPVTGAGALIEGSIGVYMHESASDQYGGGNCLANTFRRVNFSGFHRAFVARGDQMTDSNTFDDCRFVDNFIDWDIDNPQCLNNRVLNSEVVAIDDAKFASAMSSWSGKMPTAPGAKNVLLDGAVVYGCRGGEINFVSSNSIIVHKTHLLISPPSTATTSANFTARHMHSTCELRVNDTAGDTNGLCRSSLLRREDPFVTAATAGYRQVTLQVRDSRWTPMADGQIVATVTSGDHVTLSGVRQLGTTTHQTRVQSVIHPQTGSAPAVVRAEQCREQAILNFLAPGVTAATRYLQNDIRQRDMRVRPDRSAYNLGTGSASRTGGANRPNAVQRAEVIWADGRHYMGSPSSGGTTQTINVGAGSQVTAVGMTFGNTALTGTALLDVEIDGVIVASVTATPNGSGAVSATTTGLKVTGGPVGMTQIEKVSNNGVVRLIRRSGAGGTDETGSTWVEWF